MENNNIDNNVVNNTTAVPVEKKKGGLMIIVIIILLIIVALIYVKKMSNAPATVNQADIELEQSVSKDTTTSINTSLDNINVDDTTDADLQEVDQEIKNL